MRARWWRLGVVVEREGDPWTMTFHVRARTEEAARSLVDARLSGERHAIHMCFSSEPVRGIPPADEIAAVFGPYRRSWSDPDAARLHSALAPT